MKHHKRIFGCADCGFEWQAKWWQFGNRMRNKADVMHFRAHDRLVNNFEQYRQGWEKGGAKAERERIIKLLNTLRCEGNGVEHDCTDDLGGYNVDELIALIKGENK